MPRILTLLLFTLPLLNACGKKENTIPEPKQFTHDKIEDFDDFTTNFDATFFYQHINPDKEGLLIGKEYTDTATFHTTNDTANEWYFTAINGSADTLRFTYSSETQFEGAAKGEPVEIAWKVDTFFASDNDNAPFLIKYAKTVTHLATTCNDSSSIHLLNSGDIAESEEKVTCMNGMHPYGIFLHDDAFIAKPVTILAKAGTVQGNDLSTIYITTDSGIPVFIVSGIDSINLRTVPSMATIKQRFQFPKDSNDPVHAEDRTITTYKFPFTNVAYTISRRFDTHFVRYNERESYNRPMYIYTIAASSDSTLKKQEFQYSFSESNGSLVWMGDIDNDDLLDIVLEYNEMSWGEIGLFLSSQADPDQVVGKVNTSYTWSIH